MNRRTSLSLAALAILLIINTSVPAQPGTSRLLGYGADTVAPLPAPPPWTGSSTWSGETAYDPVNGRLFVYDQTLSGPGTLVTLDVASGALISATTPPQILGQINCETSTGRLLALACLGCPNTGGSSLVEVDPATGALTLIGSPGFLSNVYQPWSFGPASAVDPIANRFFLIHSSPPVGFQWNLAVIDTLTGALLSDVLQPCFPCGSLYWQLHFDTSTGQLYGFSRVAPGGASGIVTVDPSTAAPTLVGLGHPLIEAGGMLPITRASAIDEQRREFYLVSQYVQGLASWGPFRLFTFDMDTGEMIGDPLLPTWYQSLEVDTSWVPMRGRVTPSPSNLLVSGTTRTLTFEAVLHAGELYVPFVSCTPGAFPLGAGTGLTVPLAFDACSAFYLSDPLAPAFFNLTPPGTLAGTLAGGFGTGTISAPAALLPPGVSLDIHVGFLTITTSLQWTGVHGRTIIPLRS